jgi:hypothetical protein
MYFLLGRKIGFSPRNTISSSNKALYKKTTAKPAKTLIFRLFRKKEQIKVQIFRYYL